MKKDVLMKELGVSKIKVINYSYYGYSYFVISHNCDYYRILKCTWHYIKKGSVSYKDTLPFYFFCNSFTVTN